MRTAILSDIHGNLEALEAVLSDIQSNNVDRIFCLGDIVGYGSNPSECLSIIKSSCQLILMGNHEHSVLGLTTTEHYNESARVSSEWTKNQLSEEELSFISSLPFEYTDNNTKYVHASPFQPEEWNYILAQTSANVGFNNFDEKICFYGHTHLPQIYTERPGEVPRKQAGHDFLPDHDSRYLVNVGSVGQPRDNDPRACYLIFDETEYDIIYNRVEYDISQTQQKMLEAKMPEMLIARLSFGK